MRRIINHLYFLSIDLTMKFFCLVILAILMPAKVFFALLYFLLVFPKNDFSCYIISRWTPFLASLYISQSILRRSALNFLNNLSLKLNFSAISLWNHSLLVFFIFTVFKGAILFTASTSLLKMSVCTLFISRAFPYSSIEYFLNDLK